MHCKSSQLGVLQFVAVCCSVLQCVAGWCSVLRCVVLATDCVAVSCSEVQCVVVYFSVLCTLVCCSAWQKLATQCVAVYCAVMQCAAVCQVVLQYARNPSLSHTNPARKYILTDFLNRGTKYKIPSQHSIASRVLSCTKYKILYKIQDTQPALYSHWL